MLKQIQSIIIAAFVSAEIIVDKNKNRHEQDKLSDFFAFPIEAILIVQGDFRNKLYFLSIL